MDDSDRLADAADQNTTGRDATGRNAASTDTLSTDATVKDVRVQTYSAASSEKADEEIDDAKSAGREVAADARRRGQAVADKAVHEAGQVAGRFRDQASSALSEGKTQLAEQIGGVARALKASSDQFRGDELGGLADLSDSLAGQVEATQHYLRDTSSDALLNDVQAFARRRRGLFIGSLLFAGLVTAHFAGRSTPERAVSKGKKRSSAATVVTRGGVKTYRTGPS